MKIRIAGAEMAKTEKLGENNRVATGARTGGRVQGVRRLGEWVTVGSKRRQM
jgi:hypothetical protein